MKTKLYDYQEKTAKDIFDRIYAREIRGAYLGFDTGTGKTVTSISVAERLHLEDMINTVIVICPVSKVDDWKKDLRDEVSSIPSFVTSFQSAWREKNAATITEQLYLLDVLLIIDEGHKMKTYDSKQSKFIQKIVVII